MITSGELPLILLPGLMCDARMFGAQTAAFPNAMAFAGYALENNLCAMAKQVLEFAPDRFALLGHSMGARVALEVVRVAPRRVTRLALVSTGIHPVRPGEADKRYALRDLGRAQGIEALVEAWLPPMIAPENLTDVELVASLSQMCVDAGLDTFEAQTEALLGRPEVESLLSEISCPTLVATGSADVWSPPQQHRDIADAIPNAELQLVKGAGHMMPAEAPEAFNALVARWWTD
jgi:pimeloyl-ACP methyl ester carboxylesterase